MRFVQTFVSACSAAAALAAPSSSVKTRQSTLEGKSLSILPLGDSITYGFGSPSSNGYRQFLLDSLTSAGATVDYVGTVQSGTMADNDNEGHPGWLIDQIAEAATSAANAGITADAILLHAGTNDCNTYGWEEAHTRLGNLIDVVVEKWPEAKVLVAKIVPAGDARPQQAIESFNGKVQGVVDERANPSVSVVDMFSALDVATDLSDYLHPNDEGYQAMAAVWFEGLTAVL